MLPLRRKIKWTLLGIGLVIFSVIGYYAYSFFLFAGDIHKSPENSRFKRFLEQPPQRLGKKTEDVTPPKWEGTQRVNILLLGGDSRGLKPNEIPRSDSVMVASIDPVTKKSYLFSILRDTYVKIPNYGSDRINAAIAVGGPNLAMKTVSDLMGIPIQYYVYTDFKGFIALVDAVGGVEIDVEKNMKYSDSEDDHIYDIDLKKGLQLLDGNKALQYVRFRHDAMSDFSRTERQRKFMRALAEKLQTTSSLIKLPRILQKIDPYIETNLTVSEMIKLGALGFELRTEGMASQQVPPPELLEEKKVGGAEVITVNPEKLKRFVQQLYNGTATGNDGPSSNTTKGTLSEGSNSGTGTSSGSVTKAGASTGSQAKKPAKP